MRISILLLILILYTNDAFPQAQQYTSDDNTTASWDEFVWTKSKSWMQDRPRWNNSPPSGFGYWHAVNIYGYVILSDDMVVGSGGTLNVYDTLRITGDLLSQQNVVVHSGGILIIEGDLISNNGGVNTVGGTVVVLGDVTASNGADVDVSGDFYMMGTLTSPGSGEKYNGSSTPPPGYFQDEDDLSSNDPALYSFATGGTLPVEFAETSLSRSANGVSVLWSTATEKDNDYFTIERSRDGLHFSAIGRAEGQGTTADKSYYEFLDEEPLKGISYYRIRQTDLDGKYSFSTMMRLDYVFESEPAIRFYPNPAAEQIFIDTKNNAEFTVELVDVSGNVKKEWKLSSQNFEAHAVQVSEFERGYYLLVITTDKQKVIKKVLLN